MAVLVFHRRHQAGPEETLCVDGFWIPLFIGTLVAVLGWGRGVHTQSDVLLLALAFLLIKGRTVRKWPVYQG